MKQKYDLYSATNQRICDALIGGIAFYLGYQIRFEWDVPSTDAYQLWLLLPAAMVGHVVVGSLLGVYRLIWRYISLTDALVVLRGHVVFSTILVILRLTLPDRWASLRVPLSIIVIEFLLSSSAALSARVLRRILYQRQSMRTLSGEKVNRVLLIGAGQAGVMVAKEMAPDVRVKVVGFLDDDPRKAGAIINGIKVLGPVDSLPTAVREHGVEEVVICIPRAPRATLKCLWAFCESLPVQTKIVPTIGEILHGKVNIAAFRDVQMADLLGRETADLSSNEADVAPAYSGKRVLITGAGGSIGSELAHQLLRFTPAQLILLDKDENGVYELYSQLEADSERTAVHPLVADIRFPERLKAIFSRFRPEVVFHAAAHKHVTLMERNACEAILNNVVGTRNLAENSLAFGVFQFVLVSTDKAVKPKSIMGASKRVCELIAQARGNEGSTRFSCVRFGNVLNSRGSVVPLFQKQIARGGPISITHPGVQRFLMTIPEAIHLLIQAGTLGSWGQIFVLEMGDPVPILDLARDLIELSGLRPGKDIQIEMTQLHPGEKIIEELFDHTSETLSPTPFDKIFVVHGKPYDWPGFAEKLAALEDAARRESPEDVRQILREFNFGFDDDHTRQASFEKTRS